MLYSLEVRRDLPVKRGRLFVYLLTGFVVLAVSLYGFNRLLHRPALPREILLSSIKQLDTIKITHKQDIEFILNQKSAGDRVRILSHIEGVPQEIDIELIPFYSQTPFPIVYLVIGLACFMIGLVVLILRPDDVMAQIFYLANLAFSGATIISIGFYCLKDEWISFVPGLLFLFLYALAPALLLHFTILFTRRKGKANWMVIYAPAFVFASVLSALFLYSVVKTSIAHYRYYQAVYYFFRFYIVLYVAATGYWLVSDYKKALLMEKRAQIKWIIYGLFIGLGPFILLYKLPLLFNYTPLISDELSEVFFIFIPIAFAFAIIRFRLMDIELIINRSLVYSILTIFTVSVYLLCVRFLLEFVAHLVNIQETVVAVIATLAAASVFHPARRRIQRFVDKSFFRLSYDYRESIRSFNERAHRMADKNQLVDYFLTKVNKTLPLTSRGILVYSIQGSKKTLLISKEIGKKLKLFSTDAFSRHKISARRKAVHMEEGIDFSNESKLERAGLELVLPLPFRSLTLEGVLFFGKKKSEERYTFDDLDLLHSLADGLALNLERITLQEEVILERAEKHKLDELSRMKTEFIATVSHELRTPMSSIQGLSEMLQDKKIKDKAREEELLGVMTAECSRLTRFVHNILDIGKIEQGLKTYNFSKTDIQGVIDEAVSLFLVNLNKQGFVLHREIPEKPVSLMIDRDAIKQALTNLIDNAINYSKDEREITLRLIENRDSVEVQILDKGIGISEEDQKKIFDDFYRSSEAIQRSPKGVGLGLRIVKHIMEAHRGEVRVQSELGKGSLFSLVFPKS